MGRDADAIVVGGGPGGASAAYFLQRMGYSALLLEKEHLPRYKTCAGGVPGSALQLFPFSFREVIEDRVELGTFFYGQRGITQQVEKDSLYMVSRGDFDSYLLRQSGAAVLQGEKAVAVKQGEEEVAVWTRSGRVLRSGYLIAADGPGSSVATSAGLRPGGDYGLGLEVEVVPDRRTLESYRGRFLVGLGTLENGYYWVFPKAGHLSVGIGSMGGGKQRLRHKLQEASARLGIDIAGYPLRAHPIPVYREKTALQKNRVLLVGDAAGLVDPLTGEGIRHALLSGKLAALAVARGPLSAYTRWVQRHIGWELWWADRFSRIFYARQRECFEWLVRNRLVFQDVMRVVNNRLSYAQSLLKIPMYLASWRRRVPTDV